MSKKANLHLRVVQKIPFVRDLSPHQVQEILHIGRIVAHSEGQVLCRTGDKSIEMFILLAGELAVKDENIELARVLPVDIVGEMGLVTNQPRCATIEVVREATLIAIGRMQFEVLLKRDVDMAAKIYRNMLDSLSRKLRDNNQRLRQSRHAEGDALTASVV